MEADRAGQLHQHRLGQRRILSVRRGGPPGGTYKLTATFYPPQGSFTTIERDYWFGSRLIYRWTPTGAGAVLQDRLGSVRADSGTKRYGSM
ncbi:MAG TPA: hypothetical protein VN610_05240 [Bryobacteraceae bacterium]|nr:hypothetical protein [Bryobacteraceae bacterium]